MDRIDMQLGVESVSLEKLRSERRDIQGFENVAQQVVELRKKQLSRQGKLNGELGLNDLFEHAGVMESTFREAESMSRKFFFSTRSVLRLLRLARSIADLECSQTVEREHLIQAFDFRLIDKWRGELRSFY
jgi:magnesium chelatase family protein